VVAPQFSLEMVFVQALGAAAFTEMPKRQALNTSSPIGAAIIF
jgi:hypothetical protein